jgi:hypothetical protein
MAELNLTKISNGFKIIETDESYKFQNFLNRNGEDVQYETLNDTQGIFGTDKGVIFLTTNCAIDEISYNTIQEFSNELYN